MSTVTNVILCSMTCEEAALDHINQTHFPLVPLRDNTTGNTGGTKRLECMVCLGAYNYWYPSLLISLIKSAPWNYPEDVQLFIKGQHDDKFTEIPLGLCEVGK